jgi:transforming growth factor-beta-induced protein
MREASKETDMRNILLTLSAILTLGGITMSSVNVQAAPGTIVDVAAEAGTFSTLLAAAKSAGLAEVLAGDGPFTVFAPTDEAFAKLPAGTVESLLQPENRDKLRSILLYHVVPGKLAASQVTGLDNISTVFGAPLSVKVSSGSVAVGGAEVVAADILASNGIIHVIDRVILPANIVETAGAAGSFKTLLAAATAAGLADTLSNGGPFTVFAPSDAAFAALPAGTVENLLKPENLDQLKAILLYHVVPGRVTAADVIGLDQAQTVGGRSLKIRVAGGSVMVGGAKVVSTDIQALNGVIHVVDTVLLPEAETSKTASGAACGS